MTPTKADFDNAVKEHWRSTTCLVAQMMKRCGLPINSTDAGQSVEDVAERQGFENLMGAFDKNFNNPGDEKTNPVLIALREELPDADEPVQTQEV